MKTFKFRKNTATVLFLVAYAVYIIIYPFVLKTTKDLPIVIGFYVLCLAFFLGCRPHAYEVGKRTLKIKYYLWKDSEVDLMQCETICDPVSRWADIATRPHAIEIYTNTKKRYCCFPKQRVEFVDAVLQENKRLHCTVQEYTDVQRVLEKKRRKERKKAEKKAKESK